MLNNDEVDSRHLLDEFKTAIDEFTATFAVNKLKEAVERADAVMRRAWDEIQNGHWKLENERKGLLEAALKSRPSMTARAEALNSSLKSFHPPAYQEMEMFFARGPDPIVGRSGTPPTDIRRSSGGLTLPLGSDGSQSPSGEGQLFAPISMPPPAQKRKAQEDRGLRKANRPPNKKGKTTNVQLDQPPVQLNTPIRDSGITRTVQAEEVGQREFVFKYRHPAYNGAEEYFVLRCLSRRGDIIPFTTDPFLSPSPEKPAPAIEHFGEENARCHDRATDSDRIGIMNSYGYRVVGCVNDAWMEASNAYLKASIAYSEQEAERKGREKRASNPAVTR
ncbi:hypothetical protein B0T16DRAFT_461377 [Cercophora newfieldiana]|uniref:Uncharacterized protein n=1 Tax=Cercophora newfieldiana TaxID=92897 RepID=A0AA39XW07_9PEZI|nr:hypothetical protein B0T16DRAFT_461377 [Cercophora newfieldiana]